MMTYPDSQCPFPPPPMVQAPPVTLPKPNIVLVLTDDQGWTGTSVAMDPALPGSASDYHETPSLERLANEGTRFSAAYAPAPNCSPSRASVLTGKSPAALHMTDIVGRASPNHPWRLGHPILPPVPLEDFPAQEITIAEAIKAADSDYVTGFVGKWHVNLNGEGPLDHGFDVGIEHGGHSCAQPNPKGAFGITSHAISFMADQAVAEAPFFLQVSHWAVHSPKKALQATTDKYLAKPPGQEHDDPGLAAMAEDLDTSLGQLLDAIDDLGIAGNTYVIYTSDNGAPLQEQNVSTSNAPLAHGKATVFEGGVRVPFLIRGPSVAAGAASSVPVIGWDLMPTVLDMIGQLASTPSGIEGGSLMPVLDSQSPATQVARPGDLYWHMPHYILNVAGAVPQSAIVQGNYKGVYFWETDGFELYDLSVDLGETTDLAASQPAVAQALKQDLCDALTAAGADFPTGVTVVPAPSPCPPTP